MGKCGFIEGTYITCVLVWIVKWVVEVVIPFSPISSDFIECITNCEQESGDEKGYSDIRIDRKSELAFGRKGLVRHRCINDASTCRCSGIRNGERICRSITAGVWERFGRSDGRHRSVICICIWDECWYWTKIERLTN